MQDFFHQQYVLRKMKIARCKVVWQHQRLPKTEGMTRWCGWMFQTGTWDRGKLHWTTIAMVPNSASTEPSYKIKHSSLEHIIISCPWNWEYLLNIEPLNRREGEETHRTKNPSRFVQDEAANLPHDMGFVPWERSEKKSPSTWITKTSWWFHNFSYTLNLNVGQWSQV